MIKESRVKLLRERAAKIIINSGFCVSKTELAEIAVADFGLNNPEVFGAQILTLFATERISAKLIVLFPGQILPEHWHPPVGTDPGKEEILRGWSGEIIYAEDSDGAFVSPETDSEFRKLIPGGMENCFTARSVQKIRGGDQVIIPPGKRHWMKGGAEGGCLISFSTCVRDILDLFTDCSVVRTTRIIPD